MSDKPISSTYGEGVLMIDAATDYLIKQARFAQRKWSLSDRGLALALKRVCEADESINNVGTLPASRAICPTTTKTEG